jgi:putative MATE family efflux protein
LPEKGTEVWTEGIEDVNVNVNVNDGPAPGDDGRLAPANLDATPPRFWAGVREALAGSRRDLTTAPLGRAVFLLAIPMVLEMVMESIFAIADIFWVSKLGANAIAAVGLTESLLTLVYAVAMGLAIGVGAVVSRRTGAKDHAGAARAAVQAVIIGVVLSLFVGLAGALAGPRLLALMGASTAVQTIGAGYSRVMLGGSVTVVLLFLVNAAFRGAGDAALTMRALWLANGINIVLGPIFIFGLGPAPRLGVAGAAVATTIGRGVGVLYQLRNLRKGTGRLVVRRSELRFDGETLRSILGVARSAVLQMFIGMTSWVGLVRIISTFGSTALAGYTIAMRVVMFSLMPSWGLGNAAATLVGQNLGAGNPERAEQAVWRAAFYNLLFLGAVGLLLVLCGRRIVELFSTDPAVIDEGGRCLRIVASGFAFYAYGMVVSQAFNGAGDTRTPTWINFACFWLGEIPIAYFFSRPALPFGPMGAYLAIAIAFSAFAVVSVTLFRRGKWKRVKL